MENNEYLNACNQYLPNYDQRKWDKFDTEDYPNEWSAFMEFMQDTSTAALKKRTIMESLKQMEDSGKKKELFGKKKVKEEG